MNSEEEFARLKQENEYFKQVLETAIVGLMVLDRNLTFKFVNKMFLRIVGYDFDELLGKSFDMLTFDKETTQNMLRFVEDIFAYKEDVAHEISIKRKDGEIVYVWIDSKPLKNSSDEITGMICSVRDITKERETQGELWQIMNAISDYLWSAEISAEGKFKYRYYSPVVEKITGRPPEFYTKGPELFLSIVHEIDKKRVEEFFNNVQEGKVASGVIEYRIVLPNKIVTRWVRDSITTKKVPGGRMIINGVVSDITKYKKLQHDLQIQQANILQEKARDEAMLANIGDGLVVVDENLKIVLANNAAQKILGRKSEEFVGKKWSDIVRVSAEDGTLIAFKATPLGRALALQETISTTLTSVTAYYYTRKNGELFPVAVTASPISAGERSEGGVVVFRDITLEKEIDVMKTEFISVASHQLRTPLTAIKLYSEMLGGEQVGQLNKEQKEYAQSIEHSANRMVALVNDLLNISRVEAGRIKIEPILTDIPKFIQESIQQLKVLSDVKKCSVIFETPQESVPQILVDQGVLRETLNNLFTNAIRYSPRGQCNVRVTLERIQKGEKDFIKIGVNDHGIGIPNEAQGRVFEKFFRADNAVNLEAEGSGLGLYIIKTILEMSGGSIWFESEVGKGATFYVTIPVQGMHPREGERGLVTSLQPMI